MAQFIIRRAERKEAAPLMATGTRKRNVPGLPRAKRTANEPAPLMATGTRKGSEPGLPRMERKDPGPPLS